MKKSVKDEIIDAQAELGIRELIIKSLFGRKRYSKADYEKALAKRKTCIRIYKKAGIKYGTFTFTDSKGKTIEWDEEIKDDPFKLY